MSLTTDRLLLRGWRPEDREPFAALNADPEVMRYFPAPLDRAASDALSNSIEQRMADQGFGLWAVEITGVDDFAGFVGLNPMPPNTPGTGGMEIGWRLARSAWGRGYASEAAAAVLAYARDGAGLPEVWSITALTNTRSIAVMERIGLRRHSEFEHLRLPAGHPLRPHVAYVSVW